MSATKEFVLLEKGKRYRVMNPKMMLSNTVSIGQNCWTDKKHKLQVGDIITFIEKKNCWGSDHVPVPHFSIGEIRGELWPTYWGSVEEGELEPVDE